MAFRHVTDLVQDFGVAVVMVPSLDDMPLRCAASNRNGASPYMRLVRTYRQAQRSVCPQERSVVSTCGTSLFSGYADTCSFERMSLTARHEKGFSGDDGSRPW